MKHTLYCGSRSLKVKSDQYLLTQQIDLTGSNPIEALIFSGFFLPIVKLENLLG